MELLTNVFRQVLQTGIASLPVVAAVLAVRWLLRAVPRQMTLGLWLVVAVRLALPTGALRQAPYSLYNLGPVRTVTEFAETVTARPAGGLPSAVMPSGGEIATGAAGGAAGAVPGASVGELMAQGIPVVWALGLAALLVYALVSYVRLRRRLSTAVLRDGNVYECDHLPTPMVLGLLRPRIYIPFRMEDCQRTYVLCHERYHVRRGDLWWKLLAFVLCAVYWWNPAVWLCWVLFCRDLEMSCDEAVLRELGSSAKEGYSLSLVDFAAARRFPAPSPLAFGEGDAKHRVKNVLGWRRATPRLVFLTFCLTLAVVLVCVTNGEKRSWVRMEGSETGLGVAYTCHLEEPVRSWAIYQDIYEEGLLSSSKPIILEGFQGDDFPLPQLLSATLQYQVNYDDASGNGFGGTLECGYASEGGSLISWTIDLPKSHYTGSGSMVGDDGETGRKETLAAAGDAVLLTILLSTESGGATVSYDAQRGVIGANDTVVQFRLVTATDTAEGFSATSAVQSYADSLFALRSPYVGNAPAVGALLQALDVGALGDYTLELFTSEVPYVLQVNFKQEPEDIDPTSPSTDLAMLDHAAVLLALIDNLDEVRWSYPSREDGHMMRITGHCTVDDVNAWAGFQNGSALSAYGDVKRCGQSAEGIAVLTEYLGDMDAQPAQEEPGLLVFAGTGNVIAANWYPDGNFDFDYEDLPVLTLSGGAALSFELLGWEAESLTVGEDYYSAAEGAVEVLRNSYQLSGDRILPVNHLHPQREEQAVYYVVHGQGKFVFKVVLPAEE